jgi:hypothetical protein
MRAKLRRLLPFLLLAGTLAVAGDKKISSDLQEQMSRSGDDDVQVIVQFSEKPTQAHKNKLRSHSGTKVKDLWSAKALAASIPASQLDSLSNDPAVVYITPDRRVAAFLSNAGPAVGADVALNQGWDGTGVTVAVIDSGVQNDKATVSLLHTARNSRGSALAQTAGKSGLENWGSLIITPVMQYPGQSFFTGIEKLVNQVLFVSDVPGEQICHEHIDKKAMMEVLHREHAFSGQC